MPSLVSSVSNNLDLIRAKNVDFSGQSPASNTITLNGQLIIGSTALNAGGTHLNIGRLTSPLGTISIGYSSPNITLDLVGGSLAIDSIAVQTGTSPIVPTAAGLVTINGAVVAAGVNPIRSNGTGANTMALEVQISQAIAAADATKIGLANFSSTDFAVAATGFVTLSTTGAAKTITGTTGGALSPTANNWNILGGTTAAGTVPVSTSGSGSTLTANVQISQAIAAADATKIGLSNFDSARFTVAATGFVSLNGSGVGQTITGTTGGALSPTAGNWNILGGTTAAGAVPVSTSGSGSTLTANVQISQALASADATKIGLANFSSASFAVDSNGFVTAAGNIAVTTGTFTPTWTGQGVTGATTYTLQQGYYIRIGNLVTVQGGVSISAATGVGAILIGGLPFTIKNQANGSPQGVLLDTGITYPAGTTYLVLNGVINGTNANIIGSGSTVSSQLAVIENAARAISFTMTYEI